MSRSRGFHTRAHVAAVFDRFEAAAERHRCAEFSARKPTMRVRLSILYDARIFAGFVILAAALAMKIFYSRATSEELTWLVGPMAFILELFTDFSFVREAGFGWVDFDHNIVIAPSCAGVNFLIIAFCMSSFLMLARDRSPGGMITAIGISGLASYAVTVLACAARILLSVHVFRLDIYSGWLTQEAVHRAVGVSIYYFSLCFYFHLLSRFSPHNNQVIERTDGVYVSMRSGLVFLTPLFWYLTFSLGVPFLNGAYGSNPGLFLWHALCVGGVTLLLTVIMLAVLYLVTVLKNVCRA